MARRGAEAGRESDQQLLQRAGRKAAALAEQLRSDATEMASEEHIESANALGRAARGAEAVAGALAERFVDEEQDGSKA